MPKFINKDQLDKLAKSLNSKSKAAVSEEEQRAQAAEQALQTEIETTRDMFGGKSIVYITQAEYDSLSEKEQNDNTKAYVITDAEDLSHEHNNKDLLDNFGARNITIGNSSKTFDGSKNISYTLSDIGAAKSGHTHDDRYYTESEVNTKLSDLQTEVSADIKAEENRAKAAETSLQTAIDGKADTSHGNHVPKTQTANNAIFLRCDNTWATVTPDNIGAAAKSHGTHVTYSTTVPKANGTATVGSEASVARGDHVHPTQTSVSGNAGTATALQNARTITIGNQSNSFDGTANISYSVADIGAAPASHNHDGRYYTEAEVDVKIGNLQSEIDSDVKVETDRAMEVEAELQAAIGGKANASHNHNDLYYTESEMNTKLAAKADKEHDHDDDYYTQTEIDGKIQTINTAINGKANASHGNHVPTTETANNARFLRNDNTWATITPGNIGAAKESHGTHVTWSTTVPKANGTASIGSETKVARGDHVHPLQESVEKLTTARTITIGNQGVDFDGSANIDFTLGDIGAAAASHNHDERYYTEAEINTKVTNLQAEIDADVKAEADRAKEVEQSLQAAIDGKANASHGNHVPTTQTASNKVFLRNDNTWATVTPANIGAAASSHTHDDRYFTETEINSKITTINTTISNAQTAAQNYADTKIAALVDSAPDALNTLNELATAITDHKDVYDAYVEEMDAKLASKSDTSHTHKYAGSSSAGGAATSANKVNSNLVVKLNSGSTEGTNLFTFNGSAAKTINITPDNIGAAKYSHGIHVDYASAAPKENGTAAIGSSSKVAREDHVHPLQTSVSGNAGTATKLASARSITIGNKANNFDGSKNISYSLAEIGAAPIQTKSAATAATAQWYRIATSAASINNCLGLFEIEAAASGKHSVTLVSAGISYGVTNGVNLQQLSHTMHSATGISKARIVYHTTYNSNYAYLEVYLPSATATTITVNLVGGRGWTLVAPSTVGSIPSGYTNKEITFQANKIVSNVQGSVSGNAGTATKLASKKTITIGNQGINFDGSENISFDLATIGAAATSHNHTSLTGITSLAFKTEGSDAGSISTVIDSSNTYFDFNLKDDATQNDMWRWRFSPSGGTVFNAMTLDPTSTTAAKLSVTGEVTATSFTENGTTLSSKYAAKSHGTHVGDAYATATPKANGTAAVGTSSKIAREDHVHPLQTSVDGNAGSADKLSTARTITIGNKSNTFDGSANISYSIADIGAAPASHTHNYAGSSSAGGAANSVKTNLIIKLNGGSTEGTNLFTFNGGTAKTVNITPDNIGAAKSSHGDHVVWSTTAPKVAGTAAVGSETTVARGDHVHAAQTSVSGNAGTATKWKTAITLTIGNSGKSVDGSDNVKWTLADIGASPLQKSVVSKGTKDGKLTLSTDRYQKATLVTGNEIVLPTVSNFCEINLFVKDCSLANVILPDNCKWRVDPNLATGTSFIMTFIYTTQEWLAEIKVYS